MGRPWRVFALGGLAALACGGDSNTGPIVVPFGETTFVVVVNPVVNDANQASLPALPGSARAGVTVSVAGGPSGGTDAGGVVVLTPVIGGSKVLALNGGGSSGQLTVSIAERDLRELAVALGGTTASLMANVQYAFGGTVVEVTPAMSLAEVNTELARSNIIVFFRAGSYTGNLSFSGSSVTMFGEGAQGGSVTLSGNVQVAGSRNRIRGARITGTLTVPGSDFGMSFSRVQGAVSISGSDATLLNNAFCTVPAITGSGTTALGNAGMAPIAQPSGC